MEEPCRGSKDQAMWSLVDPTLQSLNRNSPKRPLNLEESGANPQATTRPQDHPAAGPYGWSAAAEPYDRAVGQWVESFGSRRSMEALRKARAYQRTLDKNSFCRLLPDSLCCSSLLLIVFLFLISILIYIYNRCVYQLDVVCFQILND